MALSSSQSSMPATRRALEALSMPPKPPSPEKEKPHRSSAKVSARSSDMEAKIAALEAQVALLLAERDASKAALADAQEDCASLRLMYSAQKAEVFGVREALDRVTKELKNDALLPLARLREETQQLRHEGFELKSQMGVFERELNAVTAAKQEQVQHRQDLAVLKSQLGFLMAAADRADIASSEQVRSFGEMRSDLAGLQQRHASLAGGSASEHQSHRQTQAALRSSIESNAMALEALQGAVGGLQASEGTVSAATEKLKKTLRRQEQLQQQQSETSEARSAELRGLIQGVVEQMRPLHDTARRHAAQIEELSSGINVLVELLKYTNNSRTRILNDTLSAL